MLMEGKVRQQVCFVYVWFIEHVVISITCHSVLSVYTLLIVQDAVVCGKDADDALITAY